MNFKYLFTVLTAGAFFIISCSSENSSNEDSSNDIASEEIIAEISEPTKKPSPAVCIWNKVSVRETPGDKGKWITSLSIGETLEYANTDSMAGKKTYAKVTLNDGKMGWARKDFIVPDAKSAVILDETFLYSRPDLLTKSDKKFSAMDIVARIEQQGDWLRIKGKRSEGKWIDEGWIKEGALSFEPVDIATAKFGKQAMGKADVEEKITAINDIIENSDLSASKFIADLTIVLEELKSAPAEEVMIDSTAAN